jgi:arginine decarboxylase
MVEVVDRLQERGMLDCLRLLHFHIGSQISSIVPVKNAMREAAQMYTELVKLGCKMGYIDVGGGLAVDYDGSSTDFRASMNYGVQEYAYDVVAARAGRLREGRRGAPHHRQRERACRGGVPVRAGVRRARCGPPGLRQAGGAAAEGCHRVIRELYDTWLGIQPKNVQEAWHDAQTALEESRSLFKFGYLGLRELARAERLFWNCAEKIRACVKRLKQVPEELQQLDEFMGSIYYCNFSIFQSAPDIWAMDQLFPFIPIHRLDERPTVKARLADLTCDSDGIVEAFIDIEEVQTVSMCIRCVRASATSWPCSWAARTRRSWATCTTSSATPTRCTCAWRTTATASPTSSRATPSPTCCATCSTTRRR